MRIVRRKNRGETRWLHQRHALPRRSEGCGDDAPRSSSSPGATTKPGSSPDMAIVPQPKCEPTNVGFQDAVDDLQLAA